jgi:hypothetical protein
MLKMWMTEWILQQRSTDMQARTWTKRFDSGQIRLILIAAFAIAVLLLGALLSEYLKTGDQTAVTDRTQNEIVRATPNTRFVERNILPGDRGTYPVTSLREYRFHEWNILPGDDAQFLPPDGERGSRH